MANGIYARFGVDGKTVVNTEIWPVGSQPAQLVEVDSIVPQPTIGWVFTGGAWTPPVVPQTFLNQQQIVANIQANQNLLAAYIAANPTGSVLTAAQTNILARMLNGLCLILLQEFGSASNT